MTCAEFQSKVAELGREGIADAAGLHHAELCGGCGALLNEQRRLTAALAALAGDDREFESSAGMEHRLLLAFRENRAAARRAHASAKRIWLAVSAAVAAGVLILMIASEPSRPQAEIAGSPAPRPAIVETPAPPRAQPPRPQIASVEPPKTVVEDSGVRRPLPRRGAPASSDATLASQTLSTEFLPLGAGYIDRNERTQLLRVSIPRSALLSMGIPVRADRMDERVQADVLLGEDGTARAIRFVTTAQYR
ncbi:MAG: hypothetical protein K2X35_19795 [Bryobacteraceae bacterium]|nr:hypothetical protein [Bryobacteraceae bacterium]